MKIKTKKTMNLPQLIEWAWDNDVKNERFVRTNANPFEYVWINESSDIELDEDMRISKHDTFTVETFEEITEDTVFEKLLEIRGSGTIYPHYLEAINDEMDDFSKEFHACIDGEFKLIWRDGKLGE
ncbi:hypothetical protein ABFV70_11510 [Staphylococcus arlettae]